MNANELADELETSVNTGLRFTAATMLRQQQAEIEKWQEINYKQTRSIKNKQAEKEALKAENKFFKDLMGDVEILVKAQKK